MKKLLLALFCLLPEFLLAQSVAVPADLYLGGLHVRLTDGGRTVIQQKVDALRRHTASFQNRVALADAHFPLIDRELQQLGVPLDFHFLAIQESGLQGDAQSIHDAVGYWQFKRESAQDFGLLVNEVVDERKHIAASTRAAAKYLVRSNNTYHNWLNSLLSYNLGVSGARPYTLPTDAGATEMEVSEKTHPYILTFLAHKVAYESACGQNPKPALVLQEFPAVAGQQLPQVATLLHTNAEDLTRHNRWLLATAVPAGRSYTLIVPVTDPLQLTAMAVQQKQVATELVHKPQTDPENADFVRINGLRALVALPGDSKESLAKRAGLKVRKLMKYNDLFLFDNITPGQAYFVQKKRDRAEVEYHIAQPGESVATVSQKYGVRSKAIWSKNRMARNEELRPGRLMWMQHTRPRETAVEYLPVNNPAALAAFERNAASPTAATPAPARTRREDNTDVYSGRTASGQRVLDDSPDAEEEADSASTASKLGRLLKKTTSKPTAKVTSPATKKAEEAPLTAEASVAEHAPAPAPAAQPAKPNRAIYSGTQNERNLPPPAPVADEPAPVAEAPEQAAAPSSSEAVDVTQAETPVPAATSQPVVPAAQTVQPTPAPAAQPAPATAPQTATTVEPVPANGIHVVQPKESLYSVARRYGLRPAELITWNSLPSNPSLRIGQTLRVVAPASEPVAAPATEAAPATAEAAPAVVPTVQHTVVKGESMYSISRKYGVTIKQIMEWNNKPDFNVKPGDKLEIKPAK
ncbi:LysM peptidoglycan-binding domain-containing protein [Hymenobacter sp. BT730]|uniref:LysM peptidoglycan-binding domain-containing protein n=1 Tax=Hymenobacter sp. BT730 TaxID=3063332 RepID=UPI0026DFFCA1|nr:LysM peptidoglycan-binding domain-containing protein [Hymenobacter sp. BT730]